MSMSVSPQTLVIDAFTQKYGMEPPIVVRAPGRVNLIGEHTDYNDGFVMPMAIERAVWMALRPRDDLRVRLTPLDFQTPIEFELDALQKAATSPAEYVKGVAWALQGAGYTLRGFEGILKGDVPIGAGLSSSAALELATARAFQVVSGFDWDAAQMARLSQKAENEWVGVNCGIMDQMISAAGQAGHALMIDCRSLETEPLPLPPGTAIVVLDTGTRRELVESAYNERRRQCEEAAAFFGVQALRDVTVARLEEEGRGGLDPVTFRRAHHIVHENNRVLAARTAMHLGDADLLGELMHQSHVSLCEDFEICNQALRDIVRISQAQPGCYGARMTGGGFGGCAVALVRQEAVDEFVRVVEADYAGQTPHQARIYVTQPGAGAERVR